MGLFVPERGAPAQLGDNGRPLGREGLDPFRETSPVSATPRSCTHLWTGVHQRLPSDDLRVATQQRETEINPTSH